VRSKLTPEVEVGDRLSVLTADLLSDGGWPEAVQGCDYVLHVASPFPPSQPKDPDELIVPAREGTLRVLRAALEAGVGRVVVTSSIAAVRNAGPPTSLSPRRTGPTPTTPSSPPTRARRRSPSGRPGIWCGSAIRSIG
jgi:nucleoside-diphosphate-sugar epimerase